METQQLVRNIKVFLKKRKSPLEENSQTVAEDDSDKITKPVGIIKPLIDKMSLQEKEAHETTIRELVEQEEAMEAQFLLLCEGAYSHLRGRLNIRQLARLARLLFEHIILYEKDRSRPCDHQRDCVSCLVQKAFKEE